jgi:hypothetical protein
MRIPTRIAVASIALLSLAVLSQRAVADTFTYTETAVASGKFDSTAFKNATVILTGSGDPSLATDVGGIETLVIPVTVTVNGIGMGTLKQKIEISSNDGISEIGFGDITDDLAILFIENPAFSTFNLDTAIGPTSGPVTFNAGQAFKTTDGNLKLNKVASASFSSVDDSISAVPEPSCLAMVGTGGLWLVGIARKKR